MFLIPNQTIKGDVMKSQDLAFLYKINDLQKTKRYGHYPAFWESTSEHTFKVVLIADYFYHKLNLNLDYQKCIELALYHDFGEMNMEEDIDIAEATKEDNKKRKDEIESATIANLSKLYNRLIANYFEEYELGESREAKFIKACDKIDGLIHPLTVDAEIMNHEIYATFADKAFINFPELMPFYREIKETMHQRFDELGFVWKDEYDAVFKEKKGEI